MLHGGHEFESICWNPDAHRVLILKLQNKYEFFHTKQQITQGSILIIETIPGGSIV